MTSPVDMFESFDDDEMDLPPMESALPALPEMLEDPPRLKPINWGALIMEIMLEPDKISEIATLYHTTLEEIYDLRMNNAEFQRAMREVKSRIAGLGSNMGFVLRNQAMAEEMLVDMYRLAKDKATPAALRVRITENSVKWGRMDPGLEKDRNEKRDMGVNVVMNTIWADGRHPTQSVSVTPILPDKDEEQ